jgi:hypothetical protein
VTGQTHRRPPTEAGSITTAKASGAEEAGKKITGSAEEAQPGRNPLTEFVMSIHGGKHWGWQLFGCETVLESIAASHPGDYEGFEAQFKELIMKQDNAILELARKLRDWREGAANHCQLVGKDRGCDSYLEI